MLVSLPVSSVALHPTGAPLSPGLERAAASSAPAELCNPENDTLAVPEFFYEKRKLPALHHVLITLFPPDTASTKLLPSWKMRSLGEILAILMHRCNIS